MKYDFQIKPGADYEFIHGEMEGTAEDAVAAYKALKLDWEGGEGLPQADWCKLRDSYLATGQMEGDPGELEKLSKAQAYWVNETKKAFASIKNKNK